MTRLTDDQRTAIERAARATPRSTATWLEYRMRFAALRLIELASALGEPGGPTPATTRVLLVAVARELARESGTTLDAMIGEEEGRCS